MIDGKDNQKDTALNRRSCFRKEDSSEEKIFFTLLNRRPLNMSQIAKHAEISASLVYYHLPLMIKKGMVVRYENIYTLQPFFYDEDTLDKMFDQMEALVTFMASQIMASDEDDAWEVVKNNLMCFLSCIEISRK